MSRMFGLLLLLVLGLSTAWAESCSVPIGARNHAKFGVVSQSSAHEEHNVQQGPQLAIDGNHEDACSQTKEEYAPWWTLEMKNNIRVGAVVITPKNDYKEQLLGAEVLVGDSLHGDKKLCGVVDDVSVTSIAVCCNGHPGRFVAVRIPGRNGILAMCQVEVFEHIDSPNVQPEDVGDEE